MLAGYAFRPRAWALALAAAGCAAGIALGHWQSDRAAQKRAAGAAVERVELRGEFHLDHTVFLDNKTRRGRPGYEIVQPLRIAGGKHVLVNRGWLESSARRDRLPLLRTPGGEVAISGVRLKRFAQALEPDADRKPAGMVWQNVTLEGFAAWSGLALEPWVLEQHSDTDDGLLRDWPRADSRVEVHESYALQWYSLAALSLILFLALSFKNIEKRNP